MLAPLFFSPGSRTMLHSTKNHIFCALRLFKALPDATTAFMHTLRIHLESSPGGWSSIIGHPEVGTIPDN